MRRLIERGMCASLAVNTYADIFERIARSNWRPFWAEIRIQKEIDRILSNSPIIFIHIPKNAGTTINNRLYGFTPGHRSALLYARLGGSAYSQAPSFAVLRDPVDRFLSGFDFLQAGGGRDVRIQKQVLERMSHIETLDQYADYLERGRHDWLSVDTFARPQGWYVTDKCGQLIVSRLFRLGRKDGLEEFLSEIGVKNFDQINPTKRKTFALSKTLKSRVEKIYADDFKIFFD